MFDQDIRDLFKPKRYVPATVQYVDIPGIKRGESRSKGRTIEVDDTRED